MTSSVDFENKLIEGDCLEVLRDIPDGTFDMAMTSPPYNLKNSSGNGMKDGRGSKWAAADKGLREGYAEHSDDMSHSDYVKWQREVITEVMRTLKDDGALFYNHKWRVQDGLLQTRNDIVEGFPVRQVIIWHRSGGINFNAGYFLPTYEVIYLIAKRGFKLEPKSNRHGDVWSFHQEVNNPHPAPFPLALAERIVSSSPGSLVLDPFMGSGTTAVAALKYGKKYCGIDTSSEYLEYAAERISKTPKPFFQMLEES